ncbi:hypothetical protein CMV30_11965 [Nibricoccus aquaticus]|uniref:Carboxypeptidase Q n=1 Tax=Nibricoccus aquaticus TaxID=2576891 RepID=A0A290Q7Y1_9BACT|nr:M28 family peptidase [Nibricoccus aquaticus]ATC64614.1 hypothetical protein CMV30_11965 [Nibricoccus aquaticus]
MLYYSSFRNVAGAAVLLAASALAALGNLPSEESLKEGGKAAHVMLTHLCDDFGGRLTGSKTNQGALERLVGELKKLGLNPQTTTFSMPGWERDDDSVEMLAPVKRRLRVAALSYTQAQRSFEASVVNIGAGGAGAYPEGKNLRGFVGLLAANSSVPLQEILREASARGLKGVLFVNREDGGQLLARTGSFVGEKLPMPVFSVTQEEGLWIGRLLARDVPVRVKLETKSRSTEITTANVSVTFPGKTSQRVVVGAHFDSWDLGQGAMDNGIGTAQLFALAHVLRGQELQRTVELIWFNGEEQGLWGSRHEAKRIGDAPVVAMINLDMMGVPQAVNALGDASLVPALERWNKSRGDARLPNGVLNFNWFGSDHTHYQIAGVRTVTFSAPIERTSVRYYHDFADTIDKVSEKLIVDSTAVIGSLVFALAEDAELEAFRRDRAETEKLFTEFKLEARMKGAGLWPLPDFISKPSSTP